MREGRDAGQVPELQFFNVWVRPRCVRLRPVYPSRSFSLISSPVGPGVCESLRPSLRISLSLPPSLPASLSLSVSRSANGYSTLSPTPSLCLPPPPPHPPSRSVARSFARSIDRYIAVSLRLCPFLHHITLPSHYKLIRCVPVLSFITSRYLHIIHLFAASLSFRHHVTCWRSCCPPSFPRFISLLSPCSLSLPSLPPSLPLSRRCVARVRVSETGVVIEATECRLEGSPEVHTYARTYACRYARTQSVCTYLCTYLRTYLFTYLRTY